MDIPMPLYLDNAATSHPKPEEVYRAIEQALREVGASPGRGQYANARRASEIVEKTRRDAATLLGVEDARDLFFTFNATDGINTVLKGWLRRDDRVLLSPMEHNATARPLASLAKSRGVRVEVLPASPGGIINLTSLQKALERPARLVVINHASNVNGVVQPVEEAAALCAGARVPLLLDAAQTAGVIPIGIGRWKLGMLACSGHKGLLGPPGTGILYIRPDLDVGPLREGGTGTRSEEAEQPLVRPSRYESGTANFPGIAGLGAGIGFLLEKGVEEIGRHERELAILLEEGLASLPGITVQRPESRGTGTVSFTMEGMNPADLAGLLDEGFDVAVRAGLHCAPMAHQVLGTLPEGSVRVSPGYSTTKDDVARFLDAMRSIAAIRGGTA